MHWSSRVVIRECKCTQKRLQHRCQVRYSQLTWFALKCDRNFFLSASACDNKVPVHKAQVLDCVRFFAFTFLSACASAKSTSVGLCQFFLLLHLHSSVHVLVQKAQVLDCVRSAILSSQLCQLLVCNMMHFALPRYLFVKVIGHIIWAQKGTGLRVILSNMKL